MNTGFLTVAAFAACMIVFVFPLFLLGTVTPSLVRYLMESTEQSGTTVGRLGAFNTVGSIIGTFLPTFVTIPAVGTAATFLIFASVLMILAILYFVSVRKFPVVLWITVAVFLLSAVLGARVSFAFWTDSLAYEGESVYNYLQVEETDTRVTLSTNVLFGVQSVKMKTDGLTGMYYDYDLAAPAMASAASGKSAEELRILILGNGTGTYATQCARFFPGCTVEGVEIDGKISDLAYRFFDMSESVRLTEYDGRAFLQATDERYDVILVDAYQDITIPFQMSTAEFFREVRDHLEPGGILVVNMNMHSDGDGAINEYLADTILSCFPHGCFIDVQGYSGRELFASVSDDPEELLTRALPETEDPLLHGQLTRVLSGLVPAEKTGKGYLLTDDRAPVEVLGMKTIERIITEQLSYFKIIYEREGIKGILNAVS